MGTLSLLTTSTRMNKSSSMFMSAEDLIHKEIELIRNFSYVGLTEANLTTLNDDDGNPYVNSFNGLDSVYQFLAAGDTVCPAPFTFCYYKGADVIHRFNNTDVTDHYTYKIMVDMTFLDPYVKDVNLNIYWQDNNTLNSVTQLKNIEVNFKVEF